MTLRHRYVLLGSFASKLQVLYRTGSSPAATPGALHTPDAAEVAPQLLPQRHVSGDWGDLCDEDRTENQLSLEHGYRLLSSYALPAGEKVWIITEADRGVTTLLLPDEY